MKASLFYILSAVILCGALLTVSTRQLLRAAVYLLFVLVATAGLYFLMDYLFLAAVQLTLYAGGIIVLIIFSIMLTSSAGERLQPATIFKRSAGFVLAAAGVWVSAVIFTSYQNLPQRQPPADASVHAIGQHLVATGTDGYMLPFELMSVLLLAAMIAAIVVARRDTES